MENQCKGMTKAGTRCKVKNGLINGYCRLHQDQTTDLRGKKKKKIDESHSSPKTNPINNEVFPDTKIIDTNQKTDENKLSTSRIILFTIIGIMLLLFFSKLTVKNK